MSPFDTNLLGNIPLSEPVVILKQLDT